MNNTHTNNEHLKTPKMELIQVTHNKKHENKYQG